MRPLHVFVLLTFPILTIDAVNACAQNQTLVLQPGSAGKCAYICTCKPDQNNPSGDPTHLWQGYLNEGSYHQCQERFLIQWELAGLPKDAIIVSATLELYCDYFYGTKTGKMIYRRLKADWDKKLVTANTQPPAQENDEITTDWPASKKWHGINVTRFVQGWQKGDFPNYGILALGSDTQNKTCSPAFYSFNHPAVPQTPKLTIVYSAPETQVKDWKKEHP